MPVIEEYNAIRRGAGMIDLSSSGKLQVSGKNAVQFLNGLVSNDVKALQPGDGVLAAFPTLQGKLLALCRIYNTGDHLLIELDEINREKVFKNLSRFVPAGEFFIEDITGRLALISLQGPRSAELIEKLTGESISTDREFKIIERILRVNGCSLRRIGAPANRASIFFHPAATSSRLTEKLVELGAVVAGREAFEIARIEAGVPREGVDAGEDYIILESELNDAVSYTKGCYLGQEVIARIHWRGQPAKRLRGLLLEGDQPAPRGAQLFADDGKKAGEITSSVHSIGLDRPVALGYIHRYYLNPGTEFTVKNGEVALGRARLVELPFVGE